MQPDNARIAADIRAIAITVVFFIITYLREFVFYNNAKEGKMSQKKKFFM